MTKLDKQTTRTLRDLTIAIEASKLTAQAAVAVVQRLQEQANTIAQTAIAAKGLKAGEWSFDYETGEITSARPD